MFTCAAWLVWLVCKLCLVVVWFIFLLKTQLSIISIHILDWNYKTQLYIGFIHTV